MARRLIGGLGVVLLSGCFYFPSVMAMEYVFEDLHSNIPVDLTENDVVLFANGRVRMEGLWLDGPANSTTLGVNEVISVEGGEPVLSVVGHQANQFGVVQAAQWLLTPSGIRAPSKNDWMKRDFPFSDGVSSQAIAVSHQNIVLGLRQDEQQQTQFFYVSKAGNFNVPAGSEDFDRVASEAKAINGQGDIVGVSIDSAGLRHSYVYRPADGQGKQLRNSLSDSHQQSEALAINDRSQIAGVAQVTAEHWRAYRATADIMQDLGTLGGDNSIARSINESGHVVGQAQDSEGNQRAFIYTDTMQDLNNLVDVDVILTDTVAINDHGTIIGTYVTGNSSSLYGFMLRPITPLIEQQPDNLFCLDARKTDCSGGFSAKTLALDGDWLALGQTNAVVLLKRVGAIWSYHSQVKTTNPGGIDLHGQRLVIGVPGEHHTDLNAVGAVYLYDYDEITDSWQLNQRLIPESAVGWLHFGDSVALHDQYIGVGHWSAETLAGFYYQQNDEGWQASQVLPPEKFELGRFGSPVQLNARWLVFGTAASCRVNNHECRQQVLIYENLGSDFTFHTLISDTEAKANRNFSLEMALSQNTLAMGAENNFNSVILYEYRDDQWQYQTRLASLSNKSSEYEFALSHDFLVEVFTESNPIRYYFNVYQRNENHWRLRARQSVPFRLNMMALDNNVLVIGANNSNIPVQTYMLTPPSGADFQLSVTADQTDIVISESVNFDITVNNLTELTEPSLPLIVRFNLAVDYMTDGCSFPQSGCEKEGHKVDSIKEVMIYRLDSVTNEQALQLPLTLNFPVVGSYDIEFDLNLLGIDPDMENNRQTLTVNIRSDAPSLRIQSPIHDPNQCLVLAEDENLSVALTLANWALIEDSSHSQRHVDWFLYQGESLIQSGHANAASFHLSALAAGDYRLLAQLIEANHVATDYQDQVNFCVQRPPPEAPRLTINHPLVGSTLNLSDNDIRLDLTVINWPMTAEGQRYRWSWDDVHSGENTALQLDLAEALSPIALADGEHQLRVELLDTDGTVKLTREVSFSIYQPKDVTLAWQQMPESVVIQQSFDARLEVINNDLLSSVADVKVIITVPEGLTVISQPDRCSTVEDNQLVCQWDQLTALQKQTLDWTWQASLPGERIFTADIQQSQDPDMSNNKQSLSFTVQQPQLILLAAPNAVLQLTQPEPVVLPFRVEQWLAEQTDQSLQWQLNDAPLNIMPLSEAEGSLALGGLAAGSYQLTVQLQQGSEPQPVGEKQTIDFTVNRAPLKKVPETDCLPEDLHSTEQVLLKWCAPSKNYIVRYEEAPIELKPQLHISNWFTADGHTRYRWWLNGDDQGVQQTLDPLSLSLADGQHKLRAQLLYTDDSESQISETIQFRVVHPQIHFLEPATDQPLYLNRQSRILLKYRIEDWQDKVTGVSHTIQVNEHEPIQRNEITPLDISPWVAFQEDNQVTIQLLDAAGHSINVSDSLSLAVREGTVELGSEPETRPSGGGVGIGLLLIAVWLGWRRTWS